MTEMNAFPSIRTTHVQILLIIIIPVISTAELILTLKRSNYTYLHTLTKYINFSNLFWGRVLMSILSTLAEML